MPEHERQGVCHPEVRLESPAVQARPAVSGTVKVEPLPPAPARPAGQGPERQVVEPQDRRQQDAPDDPCLPEVSRHVRPPLELVERERDPARHPLELLARGALDETAPGQEERGEGERGGPPPASAPERQEAEEAERLEGQARRRVGGRPGPAPTPRPRPEAPRVAREREECLVDRAGVRLPRLLLRGAQRQRPVCGGARELPGPAADPVGVEHAQGLGVAHSLPPRKLHPSHAPVRRPPVAAVLPAPTEPRPPEPPDLGRPSSPPRPGVDVVET